MSAKFLVVASLVCALMVGGFPFGPAFPAFPLFPHKPFVSLFDNGFGSSMFAPIDQIGSMIRNNLHESFRPMRQMQIFSQMVNGVGGTTLAIYPSGKILTIKNGRIYQCLGRTNLHSPQPCMGQLVKFKILNNQDFCYSNNYMEMNNHLCLGLIGHTGLTFNGAGNSFQCSSEDDSSTLLVSLEQYQQMCGGSPGDTVYKYFPDLNQPFAIRLPNPDVRCENQDPYSCVFHFRKAGGGGSMHTGHLSMISSGPNFQSVVMSSK